MKNIMDEAQYTNYERAAHDRHRCKPRDNSKQWGLRFPMFNTMMYFKSLKRLEECREGFEMRFGEATLLEPKK